MIQESCPTLRAWIVSHNPPKVGNGCSEFYDQWIVNRYNIPILGEFPA